MTAYVDLNPVVRTNIAATPEASLHTSIRRRIHALMQHHTQPANLLPFVGNHHEAKPKGLLFSLADYLELMDWSGSAIREDKTGHIDSVQLPILQRLGLEGRSWVELTLSFETLFHSLVGQPERVEAVVQGQSQHWAQGIGNCRRYFSP